ncbi:hypothetical protein BASA81_000759 [Batrachochytrium salamandrivorans]|nr:hypothetical protein BASA81_000759 [Batrachochytrium salamandrivorans]
MLIFPPSVSAKFSNSVFHLDYDQQGFSLDNDIHEVVCALRAFASCLPVEWKEGGNLSPELLAVVQTKLGQCYSEIVWKPTFGCAICLIAEKSGSVHMQVIGLDTWKNIMRRSGGGEPAAFVSTAESNAYKPIPCGQVPQANVQDVLHGLEQEIQARIAKTKDKKNLHGSTSDNSGIQYTPGFAATLLNKVIASISGGTAFAFQGGFTDVGLHTDCFVRDTAWKLVCFVLEELIASQEYKTVSRQDTKRFLHLFQLSVAVDYSTKPFAVNDTFDMLSKLERDTENCVNLAQDVAADFVAEQCRQIRLALDKCVKVQCETVQQEHQLVPGTLCDNLKSPHMGITELESQPSGISDFEALAITELIELPLNWLVGLRGFQPSQVSDMLHYAQSLEGKTKPVCLPVLLAELENCFQRIADEYLSGGTSNNKALPKVSLGDLDALAQLYRTQLNVFVSQAKGNIHALDVDFQSRETLVVWSVYCTVHKTCWKESPILQKFSVSLKPTDLAHLNVTDVGFQKLLKILHAYLAQPHFAGLSPIFANDDEVTMQFAESYALGNSAMMAEWQNFERKSNAAIDAHWDVIKSAKYRIERLESDVAALEQERISTETSRNARGQSLSGREYSNHSAVTTNLIYDIQCRINKKNNEIWDIDYSPPDTVTMCLPSTKERAMPVLFFLFMPAELRLLSRNSFLAQQMLVCKGMAQEVAVQALKSNWKDFVSGTSVSMSNTSEGDLKFASNLGLDLNMNHHRPSTIRGHITKANGIWYPNNFSHQVEWTGGRDAVLDSLRGGQPFNPFKVTSVSTTTRYTQVLPVRELQWTMSLDAVGGVAAHRGNIALAAPDQRPESLTREQYKAFASLRSQPLLQYQELCCKLCDSTLPFDDPSVHSLVKQLLGHAGPVVNGEFEWRTGAEVKDEFQTVFLDLKAKADTLKESPANLAKVLLFGQIASYYSQFHNGCGVLAREFAGFVETWGHELEKEAELVMDKPVALGDVRFRQASMFGTSLVFYRYLPNLEPTDVENMCRLFVLFANNSPFAAGKMQLGLIASLEFAVREVMAHQRVAVQETINQELSIASRVVGAVDKSFPKDGSVEWQRWKSAAGVFASEDSRYHVDLLFTGKVLVNGRPLTGLPSIIRNHNLFIKTFGTRDFKVLTMENGASKTTFPIDGFFYSFESIGNRLLIKESNETECQTLLDGEACQELTDLPPRLLGLNSLWRCNKFSKGFDETVSVFRGISFSNRSVQFVQVGDNVFEVPAFRCNEPWLELAQASESNLRRLVCGSDAVTKALSNFESEAFIHVFVAPQGDRDGFAQGSIVYNLPRYKMDFVSLAGEPGVLPRSETWKDGCWRLHSTQCLGDTLLGLTRVCGAAQPGGEV